MKKVWKPGCPLRKTDKSKMAARWGKNWGIWHFEQFWTLFSAESVLLDDFHAKEFIFWGFGKFQLLVFAKLPFLFEMGVRALFNFMRKLLPETSFKECDIKFYCYLDLHRKFELSSLISSTVIPVLMLEQTHPLKRAWLKVRWPLYKLYGRQNEHCGQSIDGKELKFLVLINHVIFFWTGNVLAANRFKYARNHWKAPSLEFWTKLPFSPKRKVKI